MVCENAFKTSSNKGKKPESGWDGNIKILR